jgi:ABC-type transporter Mla subunit MlaD
MATMIGMTAEQAAEAGKSLTFEKVWAAMDRYSDEADKRQAEADKRFQELEKTLKETSEQMKETDRAMKETDRLVKETAEQMKVTDMRLDKLTQNVDKLTERVDKVVERVDKVVERVDKVTERVDKVTQNVGKLGNTLGMLIETLVAARLWEKFKIYGLERAYQRVPIYNENKRTVSEIDILLSNTDCAIAVEVKMNPDKGDVDWHIKRMGFIQDYPPAEIAINNKRVMGAVAGGIVAPDVVDYAHECGFFVIELTGESAQLVPPPAGFTPKIWREKG